MAQAREGQAAVRLGDGRVLIMGGAVPFVGKCQMTCLEPVTASVEIYDPSTGEFSPNGSLAEPGGGEALPLNDGRVFVSGGEGQYGYGLNTVEIYDPATGTAVEVGQPAGIELPFYPTVVLLSDGRVLIAGGSSDQLGESASNATFIFDPASAAFSIGPVMAEGRQDATATLLADGRVLIVGGGYSAGGYGHWYKNAEVIDPSHPLSRSTLLGSPHSTTSTLLSDGRVLVAGGAWYDSATGRTLEPPELFDPITGRFALVGPMNTPRTESTAVKIPDGRVLFIGGQDSSDEAVDTVEAFDPDSGTFQVIATGFSKMRNFSATLLDDGEVLIAGGASDDWNGMTAASWLLKP